MIHMPARSSAGGLVAHRYRIESLIGQGGSAAVYRARDELLGRVVALKLIAPSASDASAMLRGRSEIELLASLNHRALVTLFDAGVDEIDGCEQTYLVMELVDGPTLAGRLASGPLDVADVRTMAVDLAEALHVVHGRGVVHRDITPGNVLLSMSHVPGREFTAKLADFGIARLVDSTRLTAVGGLIGTAAYLSPEQARGVVPAPPSDVYSLGLVVLESLTRVRAFPGSLVESVGARLVTDPPVPRSLGPGWTSLLTAMTARRADDRPTALDVAVAARALAHAPDHEPRSPRDAAPSEPPALTARNAPIDATLRLATAPAPTTRVIGISAVDRSAPGRSSAPRHPGTGRRPASRRRRAMAALGVLAVCTAAAIAAAHLTSPGHEPAHLTSVAEPLGTDLQTLLRSVTP